MSKLKVNSIAYMGRLVALVAILLTSANYSYSNSYTYEEGYGVHFEWVWQSYPFMAYPVVGENVQNKSFLYVQKVQDDSRYTVLTTAGYSIVADTYFCALSPYSPKGKYKDARAIAETYKGQSQTANGNTEHLETYDYKMARGTFTATSAQLDFTHYGSVVRVAYKAENEMTLKSMVLSVGEKLFITDVTMNVVEETVTPTAYADSMELSFSDLTISEGETLTAYLMVAPVDLSNETIKLKLVGNDGTVVSRDLKGTNIEAGKTYNIKIGAVDTPETTRTWVTGSAPASSNAAPVAFVPDLIDATLADGELKPLSLLGDANADGVITMADANMVVNYYLGSETNIDLVAADVNEDGTITMADANMIVNIYLGLK
ncbi:MAG: fimbrillin family protein [Prevotella sp.]|nr:fimbrillin family protein [Prevotella sp.]